MKIRVRSISDVITNSSSEAYIITTRRGEDPADLADIITKLISDLGLIPEKIITWKVADKACHGVGPKWKKGDLLVQSTNENTIPYPLSCLLEGIEVYFPGIIAHVTKVHEEIIN